VADAALNPLHKDEDRVTEALSGTYSSAIGSCTAWFEPYVAPTIAGVTGQGFANGWVGGALLPATLAYATVKGVGWYDWGNSGLNDLEMKINGLKTGENISIHPSIHPSIFLFFSFSLFFISFSLTPSIMVQATETNMAVFAQDTASLALTSASAKSMGVFVGTFIRALMITCSFEKRYE
jgi:hypothetical protein